jgi:hypothetical protein
MNQPFKTETLSDQGCPSYVVDTQRNNKKL